MVTSRWAGDPGDGVRKGVRETEVNGLALGGGSIGVYYIINKMEGELKRERT